MLEIVSALTRSENVYINSRGSTDVESLESLMEKETSRITVTPIKTNEPWCRDHGPVFIERDQQQAAVCWEFNAWGEKYEPYDDDARAAIAMAEFSGHDRISVPHVLEGGMLDSNGKGVAFVSELSMLNQNRNPLLDRSSAESLLLEHLGIEKVIWLSEQILGDDTDGHVDTYVRFVGENHAAICLDPVGESHRRVAQTIREQLPDVELVTIPPPSPVEVHGVRIPASYANFYISNGDVLLPIFEVKEDAEAVRIVEELFPGRGVIPIDCREISWALGAIHCLTCPLPGSAPAFSSPA